MTATCALASAWAPLASGVGFDPAVAHSGHVAGVTSDIECDPAPGSNRPQTYHQPKKVKAYHETLASRTEPKPIPKATAPKKVSPVKPVKHRVKRAKPPVMERVRQTCHQTVPPADLELAGLPPMDGERLDGEPTSDHVVDTAIDLHSGSPCATGVCGLLATYPVLASGGSSSGGSSSGDLGSSSGGSSGASSGSSGAGSSGASGGSSGAGSSGASGSSGGSSGTSGSGGGSSGTSSSGGSSGASGSGSGSSGSGSGSSGASGSGSSGASGSGSGGSGSGSGGSGSSSGAANVPEPGTLGLSALGIVALVVARRSRRR